MGITDESVLEAINKVPREFFVSQNSAGCAYANTALPLAYGQTISQPYVVALMTQAAMEFNPSHVLEIGTGSGYQAAILSVLVQQVITVERIKALYESATQRLASLHYDNITTLYEDGYHGCAAYAPYDAILVTAACDVIPPALLGQLSDHGVMIIPVGTADSQQLLKVQRVGEHYQQQVLEHVMFVPMLSGKDDIVSS